MINLTKEQNEDIELLNASFETKLLLKQLVLEARKETLKNEKGRIKEIVYDTLEIIDRQGKRAENVDEENGYAHSYAIVRDILNRI